MRTYKVRVSNHKHFCGRDIMGNFSNEPPYCFVAIKADSYDNVNGAIEFLVDSESVRSCAPGEWKEIEEVENG